MAASRPRCTRASSSLFACVRLLGAPVVEVTEVLKCDETFAAALTKAAQPKPQLKNGNDAVRESEALSKIIKCEQQASRGQLVKFLLRKGFSSWPPPGCSFSLDIVPPLLAAIEAYDTYRDKDEWQEMFDCLLENGDSDREWGPDFTTASSLFFSKFNTNLD